MLLRETNALREPMRQIKGTVDDIFKLIQGPFHLALLKDYIVAIVYDHFLADIYSW